MKRKFKVLNMLFSIASLMVALSICENVSLDYEAKNMTEYNITHFDSNGITSDETLSTGIPVHYDDTLSLQKIATNKEALNMSSHPPIFNGRIQIWFTTDKGTNTSATLDIDINESTGESQVYIPKEKNLSIDCFFETYLPSNGIETKTFVYKNSDIRDSNSIEQFNNTTSSLRIRNVSEKDEGKYTCLAHTKTGETFEIYHKSIEVIITDLHDSNDQFNNYDKKYTETSNENYKEKLSPKLSDKVKMLAKQTKPILFDKESAEDSSLTSQIPTAFDLKIVDSDTIMTTDTTTSHVSSSVGLNTKDTDTTLTTEPMIITGQVSIGIDHSTIDRNTKITNNPDTDTTISQVSTKIDFNNQYTDTTANTEPMIITGQVSTENDYSTTDRDTKITTDPDTRTSQVSTKIDFNNQYTDTTANTEPIIITDQVSTENDFSNIDSEKITTNEPIIINGQVSPAIDHNTMDSDLKLTTDPEITTSEVPPTVDYSTEDSAATMTTDPHSTISHVSTVIGFNILDIETTITQTSQIPTAIDYSPEDSDTTTITKPIIITDHVSTEIDDRTIYSDTTMANDHILTASQITPADDFNTEDSETLLTTEPIVRTSEILNAVDFGTIDSDLKTTNDPDYQDEHESKLIQTTEKNSNESKKFPGTSTSIVTSTKSSETYSQKLITTNHQALFTSVDQSSLKTLGISAAKSSSKPFTKPQNFTTDRNKLYPPEIIISPKSLYMFQFAKNSLIVKCHINCFTSNEYTYGDLGLYKESPNLINYDLNKCSVSLQLYNLQQSNSGKYGCRTFSSNPSSKDFYVNVADLQVVLTPSKSVIYIDAGASFELKCSVLVTSTSFHESNDFNDFARAKSLFQEEIQLGSMLYRDSSFMAQKQGRVATYRIENATKNDQGEYRCYGFTKERINYAYNSTNIVIVEKNKIPRPEEELLYIRSNFLEDEIVEKLNSPAGQVCTVVTNGKSCEIQWFDKYNNRIRSGFGNFRIRNVDFTETEIHKMSILTIKNLNSTDLGRYECRVKVQNEIRNNYFEIVEKKEDSEEPEIIFTPNEDVLVLNERQSNLKLNCSAIGTQNTIRAFLYKENDLLEISTGKTVTVNLGFISKADEGNYICKVFWISKQGIRIISKSIKVLVNRQDETSINTGSSESFKCNIPQSNWQRVGHIGLDGNCEAKDGKLACLNVETNDTGEYRCLSKRSQNTKLIKLNVLPAREALLKVNILKNTINNNQYSEIRQICIVTWTKSNPNSLKVTWRYPNGNNIRYIRNKVRVRTYYSRLDPLIKISELRINAKNFKSLKQGEYECRAQVGHRINLANFLIINKKENINVLRLSQQKQLKSFQVLNDLRKFKYGSRYLIACNPIKKSIRKCEWFFNDQRIVSSLSNMTVDNDKLIIEKAQYSLNGGYVTCRSYFRKNFYEDHIWPLRVVDEEKRNFYTKISRKRFGNSYTLRCYVVRKMKLGLANKLLNIQYKWQKKSIDGQDEALSNSEYLRINNLTRAREGIYYCTAINELSKDLKKSTSFIEVKIDR